MPFGCRPISSGSGANKGQSFVNVALGEWDPTTGFSVAGAAARSSAEPSASGRQTYSFSGDIASLAGPDGSHFLGTDNPNVVVGADTDGHGP